MCYIFYVKLFFSKNIIIYDLNEFKIFTKIFIWSNVVIFSKTNFTKKKIIALQFLPHHKNSNSLKNYIKLCHKNENLFTENKNI